MTLESRVRSKDSCPVWGGEAGEIVRLRPASYSTEHLAGLRVCGVHHRCVRRSHRGLAGLIVDGNDVRAGCAVTQSLDRPIQHLFH